MYKANSDILCFLGVPRLNLHSFKKKFSFGWRKNTTDNVHQGRFTRTIFTAQGMYFSTLDPQLHMIQRSCAGEQLGNIHRFQ